ncbi:MAG: PEPxxWA-CTERM sorting domain-containing protein, partial [Pontixanthobacter sp.]
FGRGNVAKIQVLGPAGSMNRVNVSASGPSSIFSGTLQNPVFTAGSPTLNRGTLVISEVAAAVPEPATWAMMLIGFGAIGFSLRARKRTVKVNYAF